MSLPESLPQQLMESLASVVMAAGGFDFVNQAEPKSAGQLTRIGAAVWCQKMTPAATRGSLVATTVRLEFAVRIYQDMLYEPQDLIDPQVMAATWRILAKLTEGVTLNGAIEYFDLLGSDGEPLGAEAGYINIDHKIFRVMTITAPMVIADAWTQGV